MNIEHIKSIELITSILALDDQGFDDPSVNPIGMTKEAWVQYLVGKVSMDPEGYCFRIYGIQENNQIKGYLFAINCVDPPDSRAFLIKYQCFPGGETNENGNRYNVLALEEVKKWAKEMGANNITIFLNTEVQARYYSRYGFERTENICMIMRI